MASSRKRSPRSHLIGIGLDNHDGHIRVTQGNNFSIFAGSEETHERMQHACIKVNEKLARQGKSMAEATRTEIWDLLSEAD